MQISTVSSDMRIADAISEVASDIRIADANLSSQQQYADC
jgi:hypothetical protein